MSKKSQQILDYGNQLEFKDYASENGLPKGLYYFDDVDCVNADTSRNIPKVKCDGKMTWEDAVSKLKDYFKIG